MPNKKPLWEQHGFKSLDQLCRFHQWVMDRRLATSPIPTDEEAENQHAERPSKEEERVTELKKEEGAIELKKEGRATEPKKARKINDRDKKKDPESGRNEETPKPRCHGLDAADSTNSAANE